MSRQNYLFCNKFELFPDLKWETSLLINLGNFEVVVNFEFLFLNTN